MLPVQHWTRHSPVWKFGVLEIIASFPNSCMAIQCPVSSPHVLWPLIWVEVEDADASSGSNSLVSTSEWMILPASTFHRTWKHWCRQQECDGWLWTMQWMQSGLWWPVAHTHYTSTENCNTVLGAYHSWWHGDMCFITKRSGHAIAWN